MLCKTDLPLLFSASEIPFITLYMLAFYHLAFEDFETLMVTTAKPFIYIDIIHVHARFGELDLSSKSQGREIIQFQSFQCFRFVYKLAFCQIQPFLNVLFKKKY